MAMYKVTLATSSNYSGLAERSRRLRRTIRCNSLAPQLTLETGYPGNRLPWKIPILLANDVFVVSNTTRRLVALATIDVAALKPC